MAKHGMISAKAGVKEYLRRSGHRDDFPKRDIMAFANDAAERILTDEQHIPKIALLNVDNFKAERPDDFKLVIQAGYLKHGSHKVTRGRVAEWTQKIFGSDCELKTRIDCPDCVDEPCNCKTAVAEFTPDQIWESSHPGFFNAYKKHFVRSVTMTREGGEAQTPWPGFRLMNYATNSFFNVPYHVNECTNFNADSKVEYQIDPYSIIVNFKKGVILLSYFGRPMDEEGYLMIPNTAQSIKAVTQSILQATSFIEYNRSRSQKDRIFWQQMKELEEKEIGRAVGENGMPDADEFDSFISKFWHKILPNHTQRENAYRGYGRENYKYPRQSYNAPGYDKGDLL